MAAVKDNGLALKSVKVQTLEICKVAVEQNIEALQYVKEEFRHLYSLFFIEPTEFISLPEGVVADDFTDPITLEELKDGEIYGFLVEGNNWYLAGSLKDFNNMIETKFKDSTKHRVFVPFKNALVDIKEIKWVKYE